MGQPLLSLITPAFNSAEHIKPYLDGLLAQTYPNVQYIFVNDGSTDETERIILSCKDEIEAKGWEFVYIKQGNAGQAAAMNAALSRVSGKYFSQIDSDDVMHPEYLSRYCEFLETHQAYKFCYARVAIKREGDPCPNKIQYRHVTDGSMDDLFSDLIHESNVPPLSFYMIDTEAFFKVVKPPVFENGGGQNWQILLPMAYHYKCGYMDDVLATYIERSTSHSRAYDEARVNRLKQILFNTISRISMPEGERAYWYDKITNKYLSAGKIQKIKFFLFGLIPFLRIKRDRVYLFGFLWVGNIKAS